MEQIYIHARSAAMSAFLIFGLVAIIAAGYFSIPVSVTILCCVLTGSLLSMAFKICYSKKY